MREGDNVCKQKQKYVDISFETIYFRYFCLVSQKTSKQMCYVQSLRVKKKRGL